MTYITFDKTGYGFKLRNAFAQAEARRQQSEREENITRFLICSMMFGLIHPVFF